MACSPKINANFPHHPSRWHRKGETVSEFCGAPGKQRDTPCAGQKAKEFQCLLRLQLLGLCGFPTDSRRDEVYLPWLNKHGKGYLSSLKQKRSRMIFVASLHHPRAWKGRNILENCINAPWNWKNRKYTKILNFWTYILKCITNYIMCMSKTIWHIPSLIESPLFFGPQKKTDRDDRPRESPS